MAAFVEGDRLIAWCFASPDIHGKLQAVIITELKTGMYFARANAVRHRLPERYDDERAAVMAALDFGNGLVASG